MDIITWPSAGGWYHNGFKYLIIFSCDQTYEFSMAYDYLREKYNGQGKDINDHWYIIEDSWRKENEILFRSMDDADLTFMSLI